MFGTDVPDVGQIEFDFGQDLFYDESPNSRGPFGNPKLDKHAPKPPKATVYYPDNPRGNTFLAHVQCKRPLTVERVCAFPGNSLMSGLEWDFTSRQVGDYRLRRNFHRFTSLFVTKEAHEGHDYLMFCENEDLDEALWQFQSDRHMKQSLLVRTHFSLRCIAVGRETPFEQTLFSHLYRGIFDKDYTPWNRTHLRYRDGPRRPGLLLVARSRLDTTSVLAECPLEIAALPCSLDEDELCMAFDEEIWNSLEGQEKIDACESLLRDQADSRDYDETRRRWMEEGELYLRPAQADEMLRDALMPHLHQVARKRFTAAVSHLLNLFEMCGSVYGCVIIDRKFARMYVVSPGRIAVELSNADELADLSAPVQGRFGLPFSCMRDLDIHSSLPQRVTDDDMVLKPQSLPRFYLLGDQWTRVDEEEDETPSDKWDRHRVTADLAGLQTYVDFMAAGVTRLGAVSADVPATEKLPTPVQDAWDAEIDECLMRKGLPAELAIRIRHTSRSPDSLARYLHFSPEEQRRRTQSKGRWRRILKCSKVLLQDLFSDTSSDDDSSHDESDAAADTSEEEANDSDTGDGSDDVDVESGADDEGAESEESGDDDESSDSSSLYSAATKQWILETGSIEENTNAALSDWKAFDRTDFADAEDDVGYSSFSAENDFYEGYHVLDNDAGFVLSIAEQVLQELCHIVPVTAQEMDELVQTQYKLDLERYK